MPTVLIREVRLLLHAPKSGMEARAGEPSPADSQAAALGLSVGHQTQFIWREEGGWSHHSQPADKGPLEMPSVLSPGVLRIDRGVCVLTL